MSKPRPVPDPAVAISSTKPVENFYLWPSVKAAQTENQKALRTLDWLIPDWVERGDVVMLGGDPGVGKALLALSVCLSLASCREILRYWPHPTGSPMASMILDLENRPKPMKRRISRIAEGLGIDHANLIRGPVHPMLLRGCQILRQPLLNQVKALVRSVSPDLIVLDTVMSALDQPDMGPVAGAQFIRDRIYGISRDVPNTSWLLVHHLKKPDPQQQSKARVGDLHQISGGGFVGSSDGTILVQTQDEAIVVSNPKQRHQAQGARLYLHLDDGGSPQAPLKIWLSSKPPEGDGTLDLTHAISEFILAADGQVRSRTEVWEFVQSLLKCPTRTAKRRVDGLLDVGLLVRKGKGTSSTSGGRKPWLIGLP